MKLKDKLIRKLLDTGKKHRILVYPTLALVAIISAISHAVYWGRGNGKKLVASIMVMTMLITQSLFLTSSADVGDNPTASGDASPTDAVVVNVEDVALVGEPEIGSVVSFYRIDETGPVKLENSSIAISPDNTVITVPDAKTLSNYLFGSDQTAYVKFSSVYSDETLASTSLVSGDLDVTTLPLEGGEYKLYFKATREAYPIIIQEAPNSTPAYVTGETHDDVVISAPATYTPDSGDIYPALTYTVQDAATYDLYRTGYTFTGVSIIGGGIYPSTSTIEINTNDSNQSNVNSLTVYSNWSPMSIDVTYDATPDGAPTAIKVANGYNDNGEYSVPYTYGEQVNMVSNADIWASNEAYLLAGWEDAETGDRYSAGDEVNSSVLAKEKVDDGSGVNVEGKKYNAIWSYKYIQLNPKQLNSNSGQSTVSEDGQHLTITGKYGDEISCNITAKYKDEAGTAGTQFEYTTDLQATMNLLNQYGLNIKTEADGSYTVYGKLDDITTSDVSFWITVTDKNVDENTTEEGVKRETQHEVKIVSNKKEITINPTSVVNQSNEQPNKVYDGTKDISINTEATANGTIGDDQIVVLLDSAATIDDEAAGARDLTVTVTGMKCTSASDGNIEDTLERYTIVTDDNNQITLADRAIVERKPISVEILLYDKQDSTVLFGEESPDYYIKIIEADKGKLVGADATRYSGISTEENNIDYKGFITFMEEVLGFKSWTTSRSIYSSKGTYTVGAYFVPDGKNYAVTVVNAPTFTVTRDAGVKYNGSNADTANYKFSKEVLPNGYYPGLTITADGTNYNEIRLIGDTDSDITVNMSKEAAEEPFESAIVLGDLDNATIKFQMLNTQTGAISEIVTVSGLNVDTSAPNLKNFVVSPHLEYFNEFSFGSYFHSQEIDGEFVSSMSIKVQYEATGSVPDKLYYYFVDEVGVRTDVNVYEKKLTLNATTGYYEASILIGPTVYGQLVVYASDTTGNISDESTLSVAEQKEKIDAYSNDGDPSTYFEWMIENSGANATITTKNLAGEVAAVSTEETMVWYNGLKLEVVATDDLEVDSGVNRIEWTITKADGTSYEATEDAGDVFASVLNMEQYGKIRSYVFTHNIQDETLPTGYYTISAVVYDNAGNSSELSAVGPYLIDCKQPVITDNTEVGTESYLSGVTFEFTVSDSETDEDTDGSGVSGVQTVTLYKKDASGLTELRTWGVLDEYAYNIVSNGTYVVEACDAAGNVATYEKTFSGISDTPPETPTITVDGTQGRNGWYIGTKPYITINSTIDVDGIPVVTKYSTEVGNKYIQDGFTNDYYEFQLEHEGEVTVSAWAVSASGVNSVETDVELVKVDLDAPEVYIVESAVLDDGSMTVNFRASDAVSGVDSTRVLLNDLPLEVTVEDGVISGSFTAYEGKTYSITVEDIAGNVSEPLDFAPLSLVGYPVTDITTTGAYIEAEVHVGTYPVSDCYIAYKKATDKEYTAALFNKPEADYGMDLNCTLRNLESDTVYDYKIYVKTDVSSEVRTIEGSFKTASKTATAVIYGSAEYDTSDPNVNDEYPIYVSLYEANTIIASEKLNDNTETTYMFKNVPNGSYRIVATDGYYTKTAAVTVENGGIVYPTDYVDNDGINFVLNGKSTSVVIEDNSINITADQLESIYDNALYEGIITQEDEAVVAAGGTIDVTLYASYMDVSDISDEEMSVFDSKISDTAVIERYIQLYVMKEVRDINGEYVNNTPELVPELYHPVTISFPLGDLAGKEIHVASVHGTGSSYVFKDWKNADDVTLSKNYVTITTRYFSVYALYRTVEKPKTYTVKWVDGDGKVIKTETVESGKSATPPTQVPTKKATEKYTYKFSKWDKDYTNITADTVISAWFTAHEIKADDTTDNKDDKTPDAPSNVPEQPKDADVKSPTEQTPQYGYMGSADSPKTGDATPIVVLILAMLMSSAGMIIFKKKFEE